MKNLQILKELNDKLNSFPFDTEVKKEIRALDLNKISKDHQDASDDISSAIVWTANTLKILLANRPMRTLDENIIHNNNLIAEAEKTSKS